MDFNSDLSEIRKQENKSEYKKITVIQNIANFVDLQEKIINLFKYYSFSLSES